MTAKHGDTVKVHYTGKLDDGQIFDSSDGGDPLEFTLGGGGIIDGFDAAVNGMSVGESRDVRIPAAQAYGERIDEMVIGVGRDQLPKGMDPEIGQMLELVTPKANTRNWSSLRSMTRPSRSTATTRSPATTSPSRSGSSRSCRGRGGGLLLVVRRKRREPS